MNPENRVLRLLTNGQRNSVRLSQLLVTLDADADIVLVADGRQDGTVGRAVVANSPTTLAAVMLSQTFNLKIANLNSFIIKQA